MPEQKLSTLKEARLVQEADHPPSNIEWLHYINILCALLNLGIAQARVLQYVSGEDRSGARDNPNPNKL